jgi:hypothetical protein
MYCRFVLRARTFTHLCGVYVGMLQCSVVFRCKNTYEDLGDFNIRNINELRSVRYFFEKSHQFSNAYVE